MSQKAKNLCRFTRELDEKLIELVSENDVLYDTSHKYYKDLNVRDDVWLAISSIVGKTGASYNASQENDISSNLNLEAASFQDCKTRWRSLRDLYHRKKKDQKMGKKIRSPWEYMDSMTFLEEFTTEKKQLQGDTSEDQDEESKIDIKLEFDPDAPTTSTSQNGSEQSSPPKRPRLEEHHHHSNYDNPAILHLLREIRDLVKAREDPITTFFDSMAKTVVKFPPAQAAEVKLKVCQIVTEMECKILEESGNYPDSFESFN